MGRFGSGNFILYLASQIDATTVTECLHTFCKSCIVKHLEDANTCPECEDMIHQSHPLDYIAFDRTMQDLVRNRRSSSCLLLLLL